MNSNTKPCFIRLVNDEIVSHPQENNYTTGVSLYSIPDVKVMTNNKIGVATSVIVYPTGDRELMFTIIPISSFDDTDERRTWNCADRIDCGTDIEKFKELTKA